MPILNAQVDQVGQAGVFPAIIYILTNDTMAEVTTAGYLNTLTDKFHIPLSEADMALVTTKTSESAKLTSVSWFAVTFANGLWSLIPPAGTGEVILPTIANHIATYANTTGTITEDPATAISGGNIQAGLSGAAGFLASFPATAARGSLHLVAANSAGDTITTITNASQAAARTFTIPDGGQLVSSFLITDSATTQTINTGSFAVALGNITAGSSGNAGTFISFPATAANGTLIISALNAGGAFNTTIRNSVMGQSSVISIPDPGAATANFLLDTGTANILAMQQFVGIPDIILISTGTWTTTRLAEANYSKVHSAAAETSIIGIDITNAIRTAASKGFELTSFDVIYSIATLAMTAHTVTLDKVAYANNVAVAITSVPLTGALATATQANPYTTNIAVTTPAFNITADSKYVIEVTTNNAATTAYSFYGIVLHFNQTVA